MPHAASAAARIVTIAMRRAQGRKSRTIGEDRNTGRNVQTESAFIAIADRVLAAIGAALDDAIAQGDSDADWSIHEGILTLDCDDAGKVIVNRHVPNREIWVAAKSGGFHFRADSGLWRDTRSGTELASALAAIVAAQAGLVLALPILRAD